LNRRRQTSCRITRTCSTPSCSSRAPRCQHLLGLAAGRYRRGLFLETGGFPEHLTRPSVEDIAFGAAICRLGGRIRWTRSYGQAFEALESGELGATDIFDRAIPGRCSFRLRTTRCQTSLNLRTRTALLRGIGLSRPGCWRCCRFPGARVPGNFAGILLNLTLYRFFADRRGWAFAIGLVPMHLLYFLYSGLAMVAGVALYAHSARTRSKSRTRAKTEQLADRRRIGV